MLKMALECSANASFTRPLQTTIQTTQLLPFTTVTIYYRYHYHRKNSPPSLCAASSRENPFPESDSDTALPGEGEKSPTRFLRSRRLPRKNPFSPSPSANCVARRRENFPTRLFLSRRVRQRNRAARRRKDFRLGYSFRAESVGEPRYPKKRGFPDAVVSR